ncbi:stress response protein/ transporter 5 (substrates cationic amino acid) [Salinibacter sp. 10B]|uniref:amino acid permease n=1 Tax=Salinibacter sp. 10B TaxID=1923971 RepID=UPI000CF3E2AD|nr:amino acid permease [Salinibacter sp. 10B]PQJ35298.1 stress response protein/ transporter 5 (substrates cationic amino acid) [Salinibacter sp. 10B]
MAKHLERDLGLYTTITVSIGAMIGSGLFVLPGLAASKAGPSVILAYVIAGLLVLPAALSKAEMATAMPESGGTYLYIDRAMGPLMGTISGLGAWFSLVFKSAFALVGLGAYLVVVLPLPAAELKLVSLGLGVLLIGVNIVGVKQSGRLQAFLVSFVLLVLFTFGAEGVIFVQPEQYHPFFEKGTSGLLAAAGFVFVSYAGVTKIASIAEEVEQPDRNLPLGILISVGVMIPLYVIVVFVIVGVTPPDLLHSSLTPMADATGQLLGTPAKIGISIVAVLALTSMANAGILSSSRFPLAMSRDQLAPNSLGTISDRFQTPGRSILITGGLLLVLIAFVPVIELAKLASAFKILIFALTNVALIAFREGEVEGYDPAFESPGYPWVQILGILGGGVLLTQMGWVPILGAAGIITGGILWYRLYGRARTDREGVAIDAIRRNMRAPLFVRMRNTFSMATGDVMVALPESASETEERALLAMGADLARRWEGRLIATQFEVVPEQIGLQDATEYKTADTNGTFETRVQDVEALNDVSVDVHEIVCHDASRAALHFSQTHDVRLLLGLTSKGRWRQQMLDTSVDWFVRRCECEVAFYAPAAPYDRPVKPMDEIVILLPRAPYGPLKAFVADALARTNGASIRFLTAMSPEASDAEIDTVQAFHHRLANHCDSPTDHQIIRTPDITNGLVEATGDADLAIVGKMARSRVRSLLFSSRTSVLLNALPCDVLLVRPQRPRQNKPVRRLIERYVF